MVRPTLGIWPPLVLLPAVVPLRLPPENCREKVQRLYNHGHYLYNLSDAYQRDILSVITFLFHLRVIEAQGSLGTDGFRGKLIRHHRCHRWQESRDLSAEVVPIDRSRGKAVEIITMVVEADSLR